MLSVVSHRGLSVMALAIVALHACAEPSALDPNADELAQASALPMLQLDEPKPPILAEPLTGRHEFTDEIAAQIRLKPEGRARDVINLPDASRMAVVRFTVQPGVRFPWHSHPGLVMVSVTQGELVFVYADDCVERRYPAGTAFVDPGFGSIHYAYNPTGGETIVVATFLGVPATGGLTNPALPAESEAFDQKCGVAPAMAHSH